MMAGREKAEKKQNNSSGKGFAIMVFDYSNIAAGQNFKKWLMILAASQLELLF